MQSLGTRNYGEFNYLKQPGLHFIIPFKLKGPHPSGPVCLDCIPKNSQYVEVNQRNDEEVKSEGHNLLDSAPAKRDFKNVHIQ